MRAHDRVPAPQPAMHAWAHTFGLARVYVIVELTFSAIKKKKNNPAVEVTFFLESLLPRF